MPVKSKSFDCSSSQSIVTYVRSKICQTLDRLLYVNPDLKKCVIYHILLTCHQMITICFRIWRNISVDWDFRRMMSSSSRPKSGWRNSQKWEVVYFTCIERLRDRYIMFIDKGGDYVKNKRLSYRRVTARCVLSVVILPVATQQCRNYLYDKSWPNWWYEVGGLVGGNVSWTMCTQPWRDRVGSHCLRCYKQTDDGRFVYITCIPTTSCGEIF